MKIAINDTARHLRITFLVTLVLLVAGATAGVIYTITVLDSYADSVREVTFEADSSKQAIDNIDFLARQMDASPESVANIQAIVADSKSYLYQDVGIIDLRAMAAKSGLSITSFSFIDGPAGATGAAAPVAPATDSTGAAPATDAAAASTASTLKSRFVDITLASPVRYENFLQFIHYIEQNSTKMQVSSISLSSGADGSVTSQNLTIEVFVR